MTAKPSQWRLTAPIVIFSETATIPDLMKKRPKNIHILKIFSSLDSTQFNQLKRSMKQTKHLQSLQISYPSKKLAYVMNSHLKDLKSIAIRRDEESKVGFKAMHRIHRRLAKLQSYKATVSIKHTPIFRSLREVENFEITTTDKMIAKVNLQTLGFHIRHIAGMQRVRIGTLQTSLKDFLELTKLLPQTKRYRLGLLELSIPKTFENLDLTPLSKLEAFRVSSIYKQFLEFFTSNIHLFENLQMLCFAGSSTTVMNLAAFDDYSIFSRFAYLEKLRNLKLNFRFSTPTSPKVSEFFSSLRLPLGLERLNINISNIPIGAEGCEIEKLAHMFKQIEDLKVLRSFHLKIDLAFPNPKAQEIDELFALLPKNLPNLQSFFLDITSPELVIISAEKVFTWLVTQKKISYVHMTAPGINYNDFEKIKEFKFPNLTILHMVSSNRDCFSQERFEDFMQFVGGLENLRTFHFNNWNSGCSAVDIQSMVKYLQRLKYLRDLTVSIDMENIEVEETLQLQGLLKEVGTLKNFFVFLRKRAYDAEQDTIEKFRSCFMADKIRLKNSLCFTLNHKRFLV